MKYEETMLRHRLDPLQASDLVPKRQDVRSVPKLQQRCVWGRSHGTHREPSHAVYPSTSTSILNPSPDPPRANPITAYERAATCLRYAGVLRMSRSMSLALPEGSALLEGPGRGGECQLWVLEYGSPIWSANEADLRDHRRSPVC